MFIYYVDDQFVAHVVEGMIILYLVLCKNTLLVLYL
jgi:hypothetical protein